VTLQGYNSTHQTNVTLNNVLVQGVTAANGPSPWLISMAMALRISP